MLSSFKPSSRQRPIKEVANSGAIPSPRSGKKPLKDEQLNGKPPLVLPGKTSKTPPTSQYTKSLNSITKSKEIQSNASRIGRDSAARSIPKTTPTRSSKLAEPSLGRPPASPSSLSSSNSRKINSSRSSVTSAASSVSTPKQTRSSNVSSRSTSSLSISTSSTVASKQKAYEVLKKQETPGRISFALIARRNVDQIHEATMEEIHTRMARMTHARLDREGISSLEGIECVRDSLTHLYLHKNAFVKIDMIPLPNLKFLVLSDNSIESIQGLSQCPNLKLLDLSRNSILSFEQDEYPKSLVYLMFEENPISETSDYRLRITYSLPQLEELDGIPITRLERSVAKRTFMPIEEWSKEEIGFDDDHNSTESTENEDEVTSLKGDGHNDEQKEEVDSNATEMSPVIYQEGIASIIARSRERQQEQLKEEGSVKAQYMVKSLLTKEFDASMKLWSEQRRQEMRNRIEAMKGSKSKIE